MDEDFVQEEYKSCIPPKFEIDDWFRGTVPPGVAGRMYSFIKLEMVKFLAEPFRDHPAWSLERSMISIPLENITAADLQTLANRLSRLTDNRNNPQRHIIVSYGSARYEDIGEWTVLSNSQKQTIIQHLFPYRAVGPDNTIKWSTTIDYHVFTPLDWSTQRNSIEDFLEVSIQWNFEFGGQTEYYLSRDATRLLSNMQ